MRAGSARHKRQSPVAAALAQKPAQVAAAAAGVALIGAAVSPAVASLQGPSGHSGGLDTAAAIHPPGSRHPHHTTVREHHAGGVASDTKKLNKALITVKHQASQASTVRRARKHRHKHHATVSVLYENPLRAIGGLVPERIDMGVDFGGAGPIYAIGDGIVTQATADNGGWPGGGWITYQLTDGPAAGLMVYVAEDVTPTVVAGDRVTPGTVIANMYNGGDGIETGWAMANGDSSESELPEAGGISGAGPFPTAVGYDFDQLLQSLGVPAANNYGQQTFGILPSQYPTDWTSLLGA